MSNSRDVKAPASGYLTDYKLNGQQRKGVKFSEGSLAYFEHYDIVVEGVAYQNPEKIDADAIVLVPAGEDIAWNSRIGVYGANGTEASQAVFLAGEVFRPGAGHIDNAGDKTRIVFDSGNVTRYTHYSANVDGAEHGGLTIVENKNAVELPVKVHENAKIVVFGHSDSDKKTAVFDGLSEAEPLHGAVVFHGTTSTCVMFMKGDLTKFAPGYKLRYEGDKSTVEARRLSPTHIRFETVGRNIVTEVQLFSLKADGSEDRLLFKGRYNKDEAAKFDHND
ncbi:hypothetical protein [Burkholderia sp. Ac-20379]|uniref:hypothetical protein n=1 Tax=Burkholderia sp. Ac-20379 TaxID=2703900 RepID=UPI00197F870D|nr:hypothetical protein [Burkholderia sp. Ac-20379]MBN3722610.1 hypothetical protein [Burkholderia sp. Ac-20379]